MPSFQAHLKSAHFSRSSPVQYLDTLCKMHSIYQQLHCTAFQTSTALQSWSVVGVTILCSSLRLIKTIGVVSASICSQFCQNGVRFPIREDTFSPKDDSCAHRVHERSRSDFTQHCTSHVRRCCSETCAILFISGALHRNSQETISLSMVYGDRYF